MKASGRAFLFYSTDPRDQISRYTISTVSKSEPLKKMFWFFNISNKSVYIPRRVREINQIPIIISNGAEKAIVGMNVVRWLKSQIQLIESGQRDELTFVDLNKNDSSIYEEIKEEFGTQKTAYQLTGEDDSSLFSYADVDEQVHINPQEERLMKKDLGSIANQRFNEIKNMREQETNMKLNLHDPTSIDDHDFQRFSEQPSAPDLAQQSQSQSQSQYPTMQRPMMTQPQMSQTMQPSTMQHSMMDPRTMASQMPHMQPTCQPMHQDRIGERQMMTPTFTQSFDSRMGDLTRGSIDTRSVMNAQRNMDMYSKPYA